MELNQTELQALRDATGRKDLTRVNAFVGESITNLNDPVQRQLVLEQVAKALKQIENGESVIIDPVEFDRDLNPRSITDFLKED